MAKKFPHLVPKGLSYYFRIRVPKALEATYGRIEVTQPLGRLSQPQAAIKAWELAAHYAAQFQTRLQELGLEPTAPVAPALPKRTPTLEEVSRLRCTGSKVW